MRLFATNWLNAVKYFETKKVDYSNYLLDSQYRAFMHSLHEFVRKQKSQQNNSVFEHCMACCH